MQYAVARPNAHNLWDDHVDTVYVDDKECVSKFGWTMTNFDKMNYGPGVGINSPEFKCKCNKYKFNMQICPTAADGRSISAKVAFENPGISFTMMQKWFFKTHDKRLIRETDWKSYRFSKIKSGRNHFETQGLDSAITRAEVMQMIQNNHGDLIVQVAIRHHH